MKGIVLYGEGRVCRHHDCKTRLSIYNSSEYCSKHQPKMTSAEQKSHPRKKISPTPIIDRFEENWAIIEYGGGTFNFPEELLPLNAREGDVLVFNVSADPVASAPEKKRAPVRERTAQGYVGNRNSKVFHQATCFPIQQMSAADMVFFSSREEAVRQGYNPCRECKP